MGPIRDAVGKVTGPHDMPGAYLVTHPYAKGILCEAPEAMLADVLAGESAQRPNAKEPRHPVSVPPVFVIKLLDEMGDPTNFILSPVDPEFREAVEDPSHDELNYVQGSTQPIAGELSHHVVSRTQPGTVTDISRILECRPSPPGLQNPN